MDEQLITERERRKGGPYGEQKGLKSSLNLACKSTVERVTESEQRKENKANLMLPRCRPLFDMNWTRQNSTVVVIGIVVVCFLCQVDSLTTRSNGDRYLEDKEGTTYDILTTSPSIIPVRLSASTFSSSFGSDEYTGNSGNSRKIGSSSTLVDNGFTVPVSKEDIAVDEVTAKISSTTDATIGEGSSTESVFGRNVTNPWELEHMNWSDDPKNDTMNNILKYKSDLIHDLRNETREALQEEGSHHQPVVFVGGGGYIPPSALRPRPALEAIDPLWDSHPVVDSHYPVPIHSAWDRNYRNPFNMTRVQHIEAECQDDYMKIRVAFNGSFQGLVYSSGYSYDPDCVYVNGTGRDYYEYLIRLNRCGTLGASNHVEGRREPSKNFMWNTVTIQYNPMIEEEWDEHFKVTCEYGYDFWKTVTFPFLDVEVATGNPVTFTLTPPECYMEVRYGFGAAGTRVSGPVRVGDPLTLLIYMRSQYDGFDIVVNDCYAHNGATKKIQLIDHYGCPVDSKLMSPFRGSWSHNGNLFETQVFAYLKTFRFTGSPALYIECDVRMCHGQCPSQPCYWRNVKSISKRSAPDNKVKNTSLSENVSLFQALRVLQEDEEQEDSSHKEPLEDTVCFKNGTFSAFAGLTTLLLLVLSTASLIMCLRLKRIKSFSDSPEPSINILRPYSRHSNYHWTNPQSTLSKPR